MPHRSAVRRWDAGLEQGREFTSNRTSLKQNIFNNKLKIQQSTDDGCSGHFSLFFNTQFHFSSSYVMTLLFSWHVWTAQVRVAHRLVLPQTLDTVSIWQQMLTAGRRAVHSSLRSTKALPTGNHVQPIKLSLALFTDSKLTQCTWAGGDAVPGSVWIGQCIHTEYIIQ